LKGGSTFEGVDGRPNFTVRTDSANSLPWRRFKLHNSKQDPSLLRDCLARQIYRDLGITAPRLSFSHVKLNGRGLGFYTMCESVSDEFLQENFGTAGGDLFEGEFQDIDQVLTNSVSRRGRAHSDVPEPMLPLSFSDLNRENMLRFIAAETMTAHTDGYVGGLNNYWVYREPQTKLYLFFPHTLDACFAQPEPMAGFRLRGRIARSVFSDPAMTCELNLLIQERLASRYRERWVTFLEFQGSNLVADVARLNPAEALVICKEIERLKAIATEHFEQLASTGAMERISSKIIHRK
jgi:hypothetical protein